VWEGGEGWGGAVAFSQNIFLYFFENVFWYMLAFF